MDKINSLETTRMITRTLMIGFLIFAIIIEYLSKNDGVIILAIISLLIGYIISILWKRIDPVTNVDFDN